MLKTAFVRIEKIESPEVVNAKRKIFVQVIPHGDGAISELEGTTELTVKTQWSFCYVDIRPVMISFLLIDEAEHAKETAKLVLPLLWFAPNTKVTETYPMSSPTGQPSNYKLSCTIHLSHNNAPPFSAPSAGLLVIPAWKPRPAQQPPVQQQVPPQYVQQLPPQYVQQIPPQQLQMYQGQQPPYPYPNQPRMVQVPSQAYSLPPGAPIPQVPPQYQQQVPQQIQQQQQMQPQQVPQPSQIPVQQPVMTSVQPPEPSATEHQVPEAQQPQASTKNEGPEDYITEYPLE